MTAIENTETEQPKKKRTRKPKDEWADAATESAKIEAKARAEAMRPRNLVLELEVVLNEVERQELQNRLLDKMAEQEDLLAKRKAAGEQFGAQAKLAGQDVRKLSSALRVGRETREVECIESIFFDLNVARVTRVDTGELVRERALTSSERQLAMKLPDPEPRQTSLSAAIQPERVSTAASRAQAESADSSIEDVSQNPGIDITIDPDDIPFPADGGEDA